MKTLVLVFALVCLALPSFGAVHAVSRSAKLVSYPARHPKKVYRASAHAAKAVARPAGKFLVFSARQLF